MKAIHLTAYGNPAQSLMMVEVSEPNAPSASEALVRMEYAPINYSDLLLANGVYFLNPKLPSIIGGEGAGIVEAIGPGVTSVKVGDRVTIPFRTFTWSEKVLAPARGLFVVPPSVDAKPASMLNINPTTAVLLLNQFVKLKPKDWIVRRRESVAELERLEADAVIVSTEGAIDEQVRRIVGPQGVKYAIDPVVGETGTRMYQALGEEGRMLVYGSLTGEPIRVGADQRFILAG